MQTCLEVCLANLVIFIHLQVCLQSQLWVHFNHLAQPWGIVLNICDMSVLGKRLHAYQIMFMYCLVNKLFKMIYIHKKSKKEKKREHTISQNWVVFSIRKNISEDKLASFYMQEKNMYVSFAWEDHAATYCNGSSFCQEEFIYDYQFCLKRKCSKICNCSLEIHF